MLRAVRSLQTQKCGTFLPMVSVPLQKHRLSQSCPSRALLFVQKNRDDCSSWHMQKSTVKEVPTKPDGQPDGSRREHVCLSTNTHILDPDTALPNGQAVFPASDRTHYLVVGVAIQKCTKDCSPSCSRPVDMTWPWPYQVRQFTIPRGFCDVGKQPAGHEHALKKNGRAVFQKVLSQNGYGLHCGETKLFTIVRHADYMMLYVASMVGWLAEKLAVCGLNWSTSTTNILTTKNLKEQMFLAIGGDRTEVLHGKQK